MTDTIPDPPGKLEVAEGKFKKFLAEQGYPPVVRWVIRGDVLIDGRGRFWVRKRDERAAERAHLRYSAGLERNLGVALTAICATAETTFATVFVPVDDTDRQCHLMGQGLKLSCPVSKISASVVSNRAQWWILKLQYGQISRMLDLN